MSQVLPVKIPLFVQAPGAVLDYSFDWNDGDKPFLVGGDSISTAVWSKSQVGGPSRPGDVTIGSDTVVGSETIAFVTYSRSAAGQTWRITCEVTSAGGRKDSRSIDIVCAQT